LSEVQTQSTSVHLAAIKGDVVTGIRAIYDAFLQCSYATSDASKTIGFKFDSRTSPKYEIGLGLDIIKICEIVENGFCVSPTEGNRVYEAIKTFVSNGKLVSVSFRDVRSISSAFLESAIGQLYNGEIPADSIEKISYDTTPWRMLLIKRAIREAKDCYRDPECFRIKMQQILAEDSLD
jgi:hypothetical protein